MPKKGPKPSQWREKLRAFAKGEYTFGKGQMPGKGSQWAIDVERIRKCPVFKFIKSGTRTITNEPVKCCCGYHEAVS